MTFDPSRIGPAAAAATAPGQTTQYGLAYDLATGQWTDSRQFNDFVHDTVSKNYAGVQQQDPALQSAHDKELKEAQQYQQSSGLDTDSSSSWFKKIISVPVHAYEEASGAIQGAGGGDPYGDYSKKGGLLTKDEFSSLDGATQKWLVGRGSVTQDMKDLTGTPVLKQGFQALGTAYRGLTAAAIEGSQVLKGTELYKPWHIERLVSSDAWSQAWRESSDVSLGNALVNGVLNPFVKQDKLDEWRKHSSLYQFSSFGADLATSYYADPLVLSGKGVGATARLARHELPLNETGSATKAAVQTLRGEDVTVRNPIARALGVQRADAMIKAQSNVERLAQQTTFSQFSGLADGYSNLGRMFRGRTVDGQPLAFAIHHAANLAAETGDRSLMDLTWRLAYVDPKAYAELRKLKMETPDALKQYAPNAKTFIDAVDATKTRATQMEREFDDLTEAAAKADAEKPDTFYNWSIHASLADKQSDLQAIHTELEKYDGYSAWLNSFSTPEETALGGGAANSTPMLAQVYAPRSYFKTVEKQAHPNGSVQKFFQDNPYGLAHTLTKLPKAAWTQRANTVNMHDLNSGPVSLSRQAAQLKQMFGYEDPEALDHAVNAWHQATSAAERERVVASYEETHVMRAAAQRFSADGVQVGEDVIRGIYNKVIGEQNQFIRQMNAGQNVVYDASGVGKTMSLVDSDEKAGTVTIRMVDGGNHAQTFVVPKEAWQEKALNEGRPNSVSQGANYYTPINHREFYLSLKRDPELLATIDAGLTTRSQAEIMTAINAVGTKFNSLWKPWSLLRLGWPMRVLMDEGLRGLAVLGPLAWTKAYGSAAMGGTYNLGLSTASAIGGLARRLAERKFYKDPFPLGDGPVRQGLLRDEDPIARSEELLAAPQIPESLHEPINYARRKQIAEIVSGHEAATAKHYKAQAWERQLREASRAEGPDAAARYQRLRDAAIRHGVDVEDPVDFLVPPHHPLSQAIADGKASATPKVPSVHDPVRGTRVHKGNVVPLPHTTLAHDGDLGAWYVKHADMLSKPSHRLVIDHEGNVSVGRMFRTNQRRDAQRYLQHVYESDENAKLWDLGSGKTFHIEPGDIPDTPEAPDPAIAAAAANGGLRAQENAVLNPNLDMDGFDFEIDSPAHEAARAVLRRQEQGKGFRTIKSSDGTKVVVPKAFEGPGGEMLYAQVSSEKAIDSISDGHGRATEWGRRHAIGHKVYHAPDFSNPEIMKRGTKANADAIDYFGHWADLANNQIRQDPIYEKMLSGWNDTKITDWLTSSPEGARVRQELMHEGRTPDLWVAEQRYRLNKYLPSPILQRRLSKGRLAPSELRKLVDNDHLPDVFGPELEMLKKNTAVGRFLQRTMDKLWESLGTRPIDALSRQPFAKAHYDLKMKQLINSTDAKWLDSDMITHYQRISQKFAEQRVKQHLWDLVDNTNFSDAVRFVAPFWNAQQEALTKWARIISDRPETVGRFMAANRAAYKNFAVVNDQDIPVGYRQDNTNEVGIQSKALGKLGYHPNDRVILPVPGFLKSIPGMGKMLEAVGSTGIPIGSANTVLQGENPLLPGFGPLITVPADKLMRVMDADAGGVTHDHQMWYRWLFPIGRPQDGPVGGSALNPFSGGNYENLLEQVMPGYAKRVQTLGSDGPGWSNTLMQVGRQKTLDAMAKGLKPGDAGWPTDAEIRKSAIWYQGLRIFSGLASPVQAEYRPQAQMLIDEYRKYQEQYGQDALDHFITDADSIVSQLPGLDQMVGKHTYSPILDDAQEAVAMYAGSSSVSTAGIPPTDKGMQRFGQMRDLMSAYPDAGGAIIGQDAYSGDFSSDAYYLQGQVTLGDADNTKLRSFPSYRARMDAAQSQAGWAEYRQVNASINAELAARGLSSLQQTGASDLSALKREFTASLRQRNTAWAADYDQQNSNIYDWVNQAQNGTNGHEGWAWDKRLDKRADIQGFRQYLVIRDQVASALDQYRAITGGSASLQGQDQFNTGVRQWFYDKVGQLVQANPAFAEFYGRYLDSDTLTQGSGGFSDDTSGAAQQ